MKPAPFEYLCPASVDEVVDLLESRGDDGQLLAGGQSLAALMNLRLAQPRCLIDLNGVEGLSWIDEECADAVTLGAMTRQRAVERSSRVAERLPILVAALRHVGHFQIRNRGTIGGSICHADQAAELPSVLLACDGWVEALGSTGTRRVHAEELFVSPFTTSLRPGEIVTTVCFPAPAPGTGWSFQEVARRRGDFAVAAVAALLQVSGGRVQRAAIAVAGVDSRPLRLPAAEALLIGHQYGYERRDAAAAAGQDMIRPTGDVHASALTKRHLAGVLIRRTLDEAFSRVDRTGVSPR